MKIRSFTDFIAWKEGHKLVLLVYKIVEKFPSNEKFGLTSQITRVVVSITSNIAEGFARRSKKEAKQFFYMSIGSVAELQNQLLIARDVNYISKEEFKQIAEQKVIVAKLINGLIKTANILK